MDEMPCGRRSPLTRWGWNDIASFLSRATVTGTPVLAHREAFDDVRAPRSPPTLRRVGPAGQACDTPPNSVLFLRSANLVSFGRAVEVLGRRSRPGGIEHMRLESDQRPVPFTKNRALTELVRSRQRLDEARRSLELTLEIFERLDEPGWAPSSPLREVLGQIEVAEATLWEAAQ